MKQAYRALHAGPNVLNALRLDLEDRENVWRIRVGRLRVIYEVDRERRLIEIFRVRPRPRAYEGLERGDR